MCFPTLCGESFLVTVWFIFICKKDSGGQSRMCVHNPLMFQAQYQYFMFYMFYPLLHLYSGGSLGFRAIHILWFHIKLESFSVPIFSAGAVFFVCPLGRNFLKVTLEDFSLLRGVPKAMKQACILNGWKITRMVCMNFLACWFVRRIILPYVSYHY